MLAPLAALLGCIRRTTTAKGLTVTATHPSGPYPTGVQARAAEFQAIRLTRHAVCPQWNYTISPRVNTD